MKHLFEIALASALVAGCGGGSSSTVDAAKAIDAPPSNVETVTCAGGELGPITTADGAFMYTPNALTITAGQTVKFQMAATHNVVPDTGGDAGLRVDFGATACLKFKAAGDYKFHCGPHAFKGTVTVQ